MSRIGKVPVEIPDGVKVDLKGGVLTVKGGKASLSRSIPEAVTLTLEKDAIVVKPANDGRQGRAMHGLVRTLVNNMVVGVTAGFKKKLEINGVGYKVQSQGDYLLFNLGFSHPILFELPRGIKATVEKGTRITLEGVSKEEVGQTAATIRSFRPPEPYKGKGIRYAGEYVRIKVGKAGAAA
jgi:large subunit ribosomal protein L6